MASIKKKVKFNEKNSYCDNRSDSEGGEDEEFKSSKKAKHSLDSDEEDNSDKYELLNRKCFQEIGQEAKTAEFDDDIKLTPFNMKEELEEGDFDTDGCFHWKSKNKDEVNDAWLDNIDWANKNSFKFKAQENLLNAAVESGTISSSKLSRPNSKKKQKKVAPDGMDQDGEENQEDEEDSDDDEDNESVYSEQDPLEQIEMFKKVVAFLKPGETVQKAIRRLGNSSKSANVSGSLSASQRWLKKKQPDQQKNTAPSETAAADKEALDKLTEFANFFISSGYYGIYQDTFEGLSYKIELAKKSAQQPEKKKNLVDIFAEDIDEDDLQADPQPQTSSNIQLVKDTEVKWQYKLTNTDDAQILGPFTSTQMLEMSDKFGESGVWCRKVDDSTNETFYNSKRIDFDLYT